MEDIFSIAGSNAFNGIATLIAGLVAWLIYVLQKREQKTRIAKVLVTEIRIAEERISNIREKILSGNTQDLPIVFPTKSWQGNSSLFINDFDQDELKLINTFYDYGELIEEFAKRNNNYFWIATEERAKITVQKIADFSATALSQEWDEVTRDAYVLKNRNALSVLLDRFNEVYAPKKTIEGIKNFLEKIPNVTTTTCGAKLKALADM